MSRRISRRASSRLRLAQQPAVVGECPSPRNDARSSASEVRGEQVISESEITQSINGERITLAAAQSWLENAKGLSKSEQRDAERWIASYERSVRAAQVGLYRDSARSRSDLAARLTDDVQDAQAELLRLTQEASRGVLPAAEYKRSLAEAQQRIAEARAHVEGLASAEAAAFAAVHQDPAEAQAEQLQRFSALKGRLPQFGEDLDARGDTRLPGKPTDYATGPTGRVDEFHRQLGLAVEVLRTVQQQEATLADAAAGQFAERFPVMNTRS
jgi:hypothetical protein